MNLLSRKLEKCYVYNFVFKLKKIKYKNLNLKNVVASSNFGWLVRTKNKIL